MAKMANDINLTQPVRITVHDLLNNYIQIKMQQEYFTESLRGRGEAQWSPTADEGDLRVAVCNGRDTGIIRCISEKSTATLENGSLLITITRLARAHISQLRASRRGGKYR